MRVVIDMDSPVYAAGFTANEEPLAHNLQLIKKMVVDILEELHPNEYKLYLSGSSNFRYCIDPEYKANRRDAPKPTYFKEIREYLITHWGAEVTENIEADDAVAIEGWEAWGARQEVLEEFPEFVLVSIDKDLNQVPGWHYNWKKKILYFLSPEEALISLYGQLITGDTVDNIKGLPLKGIAFLRNLIIEAPEEGVAGWLFTRIEELYQEEYGGNSELVERYNLLKMLRDREGVQWAAELLENVSCGKLQ